MCRCRSWQGCRRVAFIVNAGFARGGRGWLLDYARGDGERAMSLRQSAGMIVTIAVVTGVDMRLEWLIPLAMCCGGLATYCVSLWEARQR